MSQTTSNSPLTVVLVHGAFADSSSWTGVIERLQADGVQVIAAANPLRGISLDSAYVASVFDQIPGPVLAVGHSYGGCGDHATPRPARRTSWAWSSSPPSRPTRARELGESDGGLQGQRPRLGVGTAPVPDRKRYRDGVLDRPGEGPRRVRGGPVRRPGGGDRHHPTAGVGARLRGAVRVAGVEDAAVVGGRGHRRPGRRDGRRPRPRRSGPVPPSPRSTART